MITRIRYFKNDQGLLETAVIPVGNDQVQAIIDTSSTPFAASVRIIKDSFITEEITHKAQTLPELKKLIKNQFKLFGVQFHEEVRPRVKDEDIKKKTHLMKAYKHMKKTNDNWGLE